jgi:hypothetical protein
MFNVLKIKTSARFLKDALVIDVYVYAVRNSDLYCMDGVRSELRAPPPVIPLP